MTEIKIVILGAGFAGLEAVKKLASYRHRHHLQITLVNQHRWNLFAPLMPDLISGRICPDHMAYDLEQFCQTHQVRFEHARVTSIDLDKKSIETNQGTLQADFIIMGLGCETNYHGNDDFKRNIPGLKSLHEGIFIRNQIKQAIDDAREKSSHKPANVIVVGAGYTGFEVASHTALYASQYSRHPLENLSEVANILMVEYADDVLGNTSPNVQKWAKDFIRHYDVEIKTGVTIKERQDNHTVTLTDDSLYEDALLIWTAGVAPGPVLQSLDVSTQKNGRLNVDSFLRLPDYPEIFVAGDAAAPIPPQKDRPLRMSVQFARTGGQLSAENILNTLQRKPLKEFDPFDPGYVIPLGPGHAMGRIMGHEMHGRTPFLIHYLMSVYRSWGWQNKYAVMKDLSSELVPWRDLEAFHQRIDTIHSDYLSRIPRPEH